MDEWAAEGRIGPGYRLLREGDDEWRWAKSVYPSVGDQEAPPSAIDLGKAHSNSGASVATRYRQTVRRRFQPSTSILDILDWRFQKYLTPWIVRATWIAVLGMAFIWFFILSALLIVALAPEIPEVSQDNEPTPARPRVHFGLESTQMPEGFTDRVLAIAGYASAVISLLILLLWVRVVLEMTIVVFNIAESVASIDQKGGEVR